MSSEEQAQRGISIEAQRNLLNSYAMATGQQIRIYEDAGFSGKNTNRPALRQLLADLDAGASPASWCGSWTVFPAPSAIRSP